MFDLLLAIHAFESKRSLYSLMAVQMHVPRINLTEGWLGMVTAGLELTFDISA